jgi:tryptophanyl-tRNA synthetase
VGGAAPLRRFRLSEKNLLEYTPPLGQPYAMRVLTGIQPSGRTHVGNYLGMIRPTLDLQDQGQSFVFIADYHALTSLQDSRQLGEHIHRMAVDFLASGLDPEKTVFFRQSAVPEVHELAWYLSTLTPMGLLERCHSYKDKTARGIAANHGLFAYPVLMAADILLYDADKVPVGRDQKQHLEVARDIAQKFNDAHGPVFKIPEPVIRESVAVVPGLDGQKMSKSYGNTLDLADTEAVFRKKVMSIKTDSTPVDQPKPVEGSVILQLADALGDARLSGDLREQMDRGGVGYGDLKKQLFQALWDHFAGYRQRAASIARDPGEVEQVLAEGGEKARAVALQTLARVRAAVGVAS